MGLTVSIVLLILTIIAFRLRHRWYAPDVMFLVQWTVIVFLSSMHLYGMYEASDKVYWIILIGSISYFIGVQYALRYRKQKMIVDSNDANTEFIPKKWFWILMSFMIIMNLERFILSYVYIQHGGDMADLRVEYFQSSQSNIDVLLGTLTALFSPLVQAAGILFFFKNMKKNYPYILAVLILVFMESTISGGRFGMAYVLIEFFVCYMIVKDKFSLKKQIKRWQVLLIVFLLLGGIISVSLLRGVDEDNILSHYYMYLCGNVVFFDLHLPFVENEPWFLFKTSLWGFWYLLLPYLHVFGFPYPDWYIRASAGVLNTQEAMQIGDDMITNAFITPFYHLYVDSRWLGVIVGMFVFGLFVGMAYKKMLTLNNDKYIILYLIVTQMIFVTLFNYPFSNTNFALIVLLLLFLKVKKRLSY